MGLIHLVDVQGWNPAIPGAATLRVGTGAYSHPSAPGFYDGALAEQPSVERNAFARGTTGGAVRPAFGQLRLVNRSGRFDFLADWGLAGWPVVVRRGDDAGPFSGFAVVFRGIVERAELGLGEVRLVLRDGLRSLEEPLCQSRYLGNNALPAGLEGGTELKDRRKPFLRGVVANLPPVLVNSSRNIYQVAANTGGSVTVARDDGDPYGFGAAYASQADMEANAPAAGQVRVWSDTGALYLRLASAPTGTLTVTAGASGGTGAWTTAQVLQAIATGPGGWAGGVSAADVSALDGSFGWSVGIWRADDTTCLAAMEQVAASAGCWFGPDLSGTLRIRRLQDPAPLVSASTPRLRAGTLATPLRAQDIDLLDLERVAGNDAAAGVPVWRTTLRFAPNMAPVARLLPATAAAERDWLSLPWREATASDAAVKTPWPDAPDWTAECALFDRGGAESEAARQLALRKVRRDLWRAPVQADRLGALELGDALVLAHPRYGLAAGRPMLVVGIQTDGTRAVLTLWG